MALLERTRRRCIFTGRTRSELKSISHLVVDVIQMDDVKPFENDVVETEQVSVKTPHWKELKGLDDVKQIITQNILWPIKYSNVYKANGFDQSNGYDLNSFTHRTNLWPEFS